MTELITKHRDQVVALCQKYGVRRLDIFGSALRADFDPETSDLDFAVEFDDLRIGNAADRYLGLMVDLEDLFGRRVDLVSYRAVTNPYFKRVLDDSRVTLYAA
jgi:predicted nucleotidyltransferase